MPFIVLSTCCSAANLSLSFTSDTCESHHGSEHDIMGTRHRLFHHANASSHNRSTCTCVHTYTAPNRSDSRSKSYSRHTAHRHFHRYSSTLNRKLHHLSPQTEHFVAFSTAPQHKLTMNLHLIWLHSINKKKVMD